MSAVVEIPLQGRSELKARVDAVDEQWVGPYRWFEYKTRSKIYAQAHVPSGLRETVGHSLVLMHRIVAHPPKDYRVQHVDGDGLNNCRENLLVERKERWKGYQWDIEHSAWHWTAAGEEGWCSDEMDAAFYRDWAMVDRDGLENVAGRTNFPRHGLEAMIDGAKARGERRG